MRPGLLLLAALALACGPQAPTGEVAPLLDGRHAPLVLTESALLELPPAYSGNRFLAGWWPQRRGARRWLLNVGDRATLEAVFLDGRERRLHLRLEIREAEPGATFGARVAGRELPPLPLVPDAELPLPGGLPLGRLPIELDLRGARVVVAAAGFGHAWPPGEIELGSATIVQGGGYSAIDFPRRLRGPATLVGRFEPPPAAEPDQRFALLVETDAGGSETAFEWRPGGRRAARPRPLRLELPAGFVRIRLLAQGLGAAGRWHGLGIAGGAPAAAPPRLSTGAGRQDGPIYVAASERYKLVRAPDLGLAGDGAPSRDAEYLFDLRRDPGESRNLAGTGVGAVEIDWLRAWLEAWIERGAA